MWKKNKLKSHEFGWLELDNAAMQRTVQIRKDGVVHMHHAYDEDNPDYWCIDDIDLEIKMLKKLKSLAKEHYGENWGGKGL